MRDVTHKAIYLEHAEKWERVQRSRMKLRDDGKYFVWDYWDPAGRGATRRMALSSTGWACTRTADTTGGMSQGSWRRTSGLVFTKEDIARLIATNGTSCGTSKSRAQSSSGLDGEKPDPRWANERPGVLWTALALMTRRCGRAYL